MLEMKNVTAGYGKKIVLREAEITLERGHLTGIVGVNGCGKSTLLKTIMGLIPATEGEILIDGRPIRNMSRVEIARRVAYLSQGRDTPRMTVMQLVLHGRFPYLSYPRRYGQGDRRIALDAMEQVGIAELAERPLATLSGGMRQNAYLAMALAQEADYLLLDEPTTYLDIGHQLELMRLLRRLAEQGKGIVTVIHDLPLAFRFSHRVAVINDGRASAVGSPEQVLRTGILRETFGVDLREESYGYDYGKAEENKDDSERKRIEP